MFYQTPCPMQIYSSFSCVEVLLVVTSWYNIGDGYIINACAIFILLLAEEKGSIMLLLSLSSAFGASCSLIFQNGIHFICFTIVLYLLAFVSTCLVCGAKDIVNMHIVIVLNAVRKNPKHENFKET